MHRLKKGKGMGCFTANTKLGIAMIDGIGGAGKVNNMLATINLPTVSNKNLLAMERRAGEFVEKVADRSVKQAAHVAFHEEMRDVANAESAQAARSMDWIDEDLGVGILPEESPSLKDKIRTSVTLESPDGEIHQPTKPSFTPTRKAIQSKKSKKQLSSLYPCKTRTGMSCAVDTAWQKRGFDSLTSHTFFMSTKKYGKKVIKDIISHRTCRTCKWWRRNRPGQPVRQHRCVQNHSGSSKLMESVSGVEGVRLLTKEGTPVEYIEGDGDNTLIARLKSQMNIDMKKRFDKNHIIKNIGKSLYSLHHEKGVKLSKTVILHLQKCISYALAKNSGDKVALEENLRAIIPHNFGDHAHCNGKFCGYIRKPDEHYTHRSLPYKSALKDQSLRSRLEDLMAPVICRADQLADLGSSQQCEHANREVALRAPKSLHYGDSAALDFRVHATSAFINEGRHYIAKVNSEAGLSPGSNTLAYAEKCAKRREYYQARFQLPAAKRRRLELKKERCVTQGAKESLEGASYQSGIGHENEVDITQLPDAIPRGTFKPVCLANDQPKVIAFDLETTDLIRGRQYPHITQISACHRNNGSTFNKYVLPEVPITASAEKVTGLTACGSKLFLNGQEVACVGVKEALNDFCSWLEQDKNVILLAHNGRRFDFPVILNVLKVLNLEQRFISCVSGLVDTLPIFKKHFPGRSSYSQVNIVQDVLNISYPAHDSLEDVKALSKLTSSTCPSDEVMKFSFSPKCVLYTQQFNEAKVKNLPSLNVLVANGVCKRATAENIAGSGLNLQYLRTIFNRAGEDGLRNTFIGQNTEGQPRVTNTPRVLESVIPKLIEFFNTNTV